MSARVRIIDSGRWSGGGQAVMSNLRFAARSFPDWLSMEQGEVALVARNAVPASLMRPGGYIWMPQNAMPWARGPGSSREKLRKLALFVASEVSGRRAVGMVRISSALPQRSEVVSRVFPNVLDEGFEVALKGRPPAEKNRLYIVCVGSICSYRNIFNLIAGYDLYREAGGSWSLRIVGPVDSPPVLRRIFRRTEGRDDVLVEPEFHSRARVLQLMSDSEAVVFPSLIEASPVAVLEAIAVAPRVVLSSISGHVETVAGRLRDDCYFDPASPSSIRDCLIAAEQWTSELVHESLASKTARESERVKWTEGFVAEVERILSR